MTMSAARPDERQARYCPVECATCGARVLAAKFSQAHTSVQWDLEAVWLCREFSQRRLAGADTPAGPAGLAESCGSMRAAIGAAVRDGRLPVAPPWPSGP